MIYAVVLLSLMLLVSIFVIVNIYRKYSQLEEIAMDNQEFILAIRNRILSQRSYLRQLDRRGSFESDDEVGYFFKELKKVINDIVQYLDLEDNEEERTPSVLGSIRTLNEE